MEIMDYVKPELIIVAVVLYVVGVALKKSNAKDNYIPSILGICGVFICSLYVFGTSEFGTTQEIALGAFTALTQGLLVAGLSTYVNQILKQLDKYVEEEVSDDGN